MGGHNGTHGIVEENRQTLVDNLWSPSRRRTREIRSPPGLKRPTYDISKEQDLVAVSDESRFVYGMADVPRAPSGGPS